MTRRLLASTAAAAAVLLAGCTNPGDRELWAIRAITVRGPQERQLADYYAESLKLVPQLKPGKVQILSDEDATHVYYGEYELRWDSGAGREVFKPEPNDDLALIQSLVSSSGARPFLAATIEPLPTDPLGNPKWDARRADGYWSLHVAVWENVGPFRSRRQAAVEYCRQLREQGYEAYFFHGPRYSDVVVGTFPKDAIVTIQQKRASLTGARVHTSYARIVDPRLLELKRAFPHNLENGAVVTEVYVDPQNNVRTEHKRESFPIILPRAEQQEAESDWTTRGLDS